MKFFIAFAAIVAVAVARPGSNVFTLEELSQALQNPSVNPAAVPYLEAALNQIMTALHAGQQVESVYVPLPLHLALTDSKPIAALEPENVAEIPAPASGSPLVQIIVNVNNKQQEVSIPESIVTPVQVIDEAPVVPEVVLQPEVSPIDVIAINPIVPGPVEVIEEVEAVPRPEINPIDTVAVAGIESWGPDGSLLPVNAVDVGPM